MHHVNTLLASAAILMLIAGCSDSSSNGTPDSGSSSPIDSSTPATTDSGSDAGACTLPVTASTGVPECDQCAQAQCCSKVMACLNLPSCAAIYSCTQACSDGKFPDGGTFDAGARVLTPGWRVRLDSDGGDASGSDASSSNDAAASSDSAAGDDGGQSPFNECWSACYDPAPASAQSVFDDQDTCTSNKCTACN